MRSWRLLPYFSVAMQPKSLAGIQWYVPTLFTYITFPLPTMSVFSECVAINRLRDSQHAVTRDLWTCTLGTLELCHTITAQVTICTSDLVHTSLKPVNHNSPYAASCTCTVHMYKPSVTIFIKGNTVHLSVSQLHGLVHTCATTHAHIQSETMWTVQTSFWNLGYPYAVTRCNR